MAALGINLYKYLLVKDYTHYLIAITTYFGKLIRTLYLDMNLHNYI
ncbi:hypothetical protein NIES4103_21020 [Nostoc sp. NIES-4103]|nr:hypothetical protein NIES4103_21020 [Nostoc sp. NIES-4103]